LWPRRDAESWSKAISLSPPNESGRSEKPRGNTSEKVLPGKTIPDQSATKPTLNELVPFADSEEVRQARRMLSGVQRGIADPCPGSQRTADLLALLWSLLAQFLAEQEGRTIALPSFQRDLFSRTGKFLVDHEVSLINGLSRNFSSKVNFVELGSGIGLLPIALGGLGYSTTGIEGDTKRHALALDILSFLHSQNFPGTQNVRLIFQVLPRAEPIASNSGTAAIVSNLLLAPQYITYTNWFKYLQAFPMAVINVGRFIERRTTVESHKKLIGKFAAAGFVSGELISTDEKDKSIYLFLANLQSIKGNFDSPGANARSTACSEMASRYIGRVSRADCRVVQGWALNGTSTAPVHVRIEVDSQPVCIARAADFCYDPTTGHPTGYHGFRVKLPATLMNGRQRQIDVFVVEGDVKLAGASSRPVSFPLIALENLPESEELPFLLGSTETTGEPPSAMPTIIAHDDPVDAGSDISAIDVSLVIVNRSAGGSLREFLVSLGTLRRPHIEIVIVEQGSQVHDPEAIETLRPGLPVKSIYQNGIFSVAESNNLAVRQAHGKYILFADPGVILARDYIAEMQLVLEKNSDVGVVGVPLMTPDSDEQSQRQLSHHYAGFEFSPEPGPKGRLIYHPNEISAEAADLRAGRVVETVAVSAALCMVRRADFLAVGGFHTGYLDGYEDVDLCLSIRRQLGKRAVCVMNALAIDNRNGTREHNSPSLRPGPSLVQYRAWTAKRDLMLRRFGPMVFFRTIRETIAGSRAWRDTLPRVTLIVAATNTDAGDYIAALELSAAVRALFSWDVAFAVMGQRDMAGSDIVISMRYDWAIDEIGGLNPGAVLIAFIHDQIDEWIVSANLGKYHLLFCGSREAAYTIYRATGYTAVPLPVLFDPHRSRQPARPPAQQVAAYAAGKSALATALKAAICEQLSDSLRIAIKIGIPSSAEQERWGEFHFANALRKAFERMGCYARVDILPGWYSGITAGDDVVIALRGALQYEIVPGPLTCLWLISHPDTVSVSELQQFHHVFVASNSYAQRLAGRLGNSVSGLLQCTDPEVFRPGIYGDLRNQVIFVGNTRGQRRPIISWAMEAGLDFKVFGGGWAGLIPPANYGGDFIPNDRLAAYYGNGNIVLNDHWPDMAAEGFLSNRLFDAAAAGANIISDDAEGLRSVFGELVTVCRSAEELKAGVAAIKRRVGDSAQEQAALCELVLREHTFDHRAAKILATARRLIGLDASVLAEG
jgi:GT2 family glycosyltransferase